MLTLYDDGLRIGKGLEQYKVDYCQGRLLAFSVNIHMKQKSHGACVYLTGTVKLHALYDSVALHGLPSVATMILVLFDVKG